MKSIGKKLIIISFVLAIISTMAIFSYLQSLKKPSNTVKSITVLVAAETIPGRNLISKKMLKEVEVPNSLIFNDYIKDSTKVIGKYSKRSIVKDEGFHNDNLLSESGDEISLNIEKDHRAMSINVTGDSAVSDLLKTGDFVDIISYLPERKELEKIVRPDTAKIILQNIEILAVDKQIIRADNTKDTKDTKDAKETTDVVPPTFLVTLSVHLNDIEKLVLAEDLGSIKLALRPLNKEENNNTKGAVWQDIMVSSAGATSTPVGDNVSTVPKEATSNETASKYTYYTIKRGDTLRIISKSLYGDAKKYTLIKEANNIKDENKIKVGTIIKIPVI
jgi:pilus assembly protein CpaB